MDIHRTWFERIKAHVRVVVRVRPIATIEKYPSISCSLKSGFFLFGLKLVETADQVIHAAGQVAAGLGYTCHTLLATAYEVPATNTLARSFAATSIRAASAAAAFSLLRGLALGLATAALALGFWCCLSSLALRLARLTSRLSSLALGLASGLTSLALGLASGLTSLALGLASGLASLALGLASGLASLTSLGSGLASLARLAFLGGTTSRTRFLRSGFYALNLANQSASLSSQRVERTLNFLGQSQHGVGLSLLSSLGRSGALGRAFAHALALWS